MEATEGIVLKVGGVIYYTREYYQRDLGEARITKISNTHWTVEIYHSEFKVPKVHSDHLPAFMREREGYAFWLSRKAYEKWVVDHKWMKYHRRNILQQIEWNRNPELWRKLAVVIGYEERSEMP